MEEKQNRERGPETVPLELKLSIDPRINVAMQQNDVPVIKEVVLRNNSDTAIGNVVLRITPEPAFAHETEVKIAGIPRHGELRLGAQDLDLTLSPDFLFGLDERIGGFLHISLCNTEQIFRESHHVELLAYTEVGRFTRTPGDAGSVRAAQRSCNWAHPAGNRDRFGGMARKHCALRLSAA